MTEVAGTTALYIDPTDETGSASHIATNFDRLPMFRQASLQNAERFHPDQIFPLYERFFAAVARGETPHATAFIPQNEPVAKQQGTQ